MHLNVSFSTVFLFFKIYLVVVLTVVLIRFIAPTSSANTVPLLNNEKTIEAFETDVQHLQFIDADTVRKFLINDDDKYVRNMSKSDLHARKVACEEAYRLRAYFAVADFTEEQRDLLRKGTVAADNFFRSYTGQVSNTGRYGIPETINIIAYFDGERAAALPWKLAFVSDDYEEGLPHTRGDYIFISPSTLAESYLDFVETLIHEKIHIYQRYYARIPVYLTHLKRDVLLTDYMVSEMGFQKVRRRSEAPCDLRANPDLDDWIYRDPKTRQEMKLCYRSGVPSGITDVIGESQNEHPFEWIAYEISRRYKNRTA